MSMVILVMVLVIEQGDGSISLVIQFKVMCLQQAWHQQVLRVRQGVGGQVDAATEFGDFSSILTCLLSCIGLVIFYAFWTWFQVLVVLAK